MWCRHVDKTVGLPDVWVFENHAWPRAQRLKCVLLAKRWFHLVFFKRQINQDVGGCKWVGNTTHLTLIPVIITEFLKLQLLREDFHRPQGVGADGPQLRWRLHDRLMLQRPNSQGVVGSDWGVQDGNAGSRSRGRVHYLGAWDVQLGHQWGGRQRQQGRNSGWTVPGFRIER